MAVEMNVLDKASVESACAKILEKYGAVDILLNGAGATIRRELRRGTTSLPKKWKRLTRTARLRA